MIMMMYYNNVDDKDGGVMLCFRYVSVHKIGKSYESKRKLFTSTLTAKAAALGYIETLEGSLGQFGRNSLFRILGLTGIAGKELVNAATPRIW